MSLESYSELTNTADLLLLSILILEGVVFDIRSSGDTAVLFSAHLISNLSPS